MKIPSRRFTSGLRSRRPRLALIHLACSAVVGILAAVVVFAIWYPQPYARLAGGGALFTILVSVDVVLGPALTGVAASPAKRIPELRRDIAVIVMVQLAAFAYGAYTLALARPVYLAFEVDRFRVVTAADIEPALLTDAPAELRTLPWLGPRVIAAVKPTDPAEQLTSIELAAAGFDLSFTPKNWRPYEPIAGVAWARAMPLPTLLARRPEQTSAARRIAVGASLDLAQLRFLPVVSRHESWVAIISGPGARIVGYLPIDGFL